MKVLVGVLFVLFVSLQVRLWFGDGSIQEVSRLQDEAKTAAADVKSLTERNQVLAAETADLKGGNEAIGERARSELGMIREGETFYQFVLEEGAQSEDCAQWGDESVTNDDQAVASNSIINCDFESSGTSLNE